VHAELPTDHRFYFGDPTEPLGASAGNLQQFHHELRACSPLVLRHHLNRNDFSRWVQDVMQDAEFAQRLRAIEEEAQNSSAAGLTEQLRAEILDEVERRYLG
jgi:hypothetical protein